MVADFQGLGVFLGVFPVLFLPLKRNWESELGKTEQKPSFRAHVWFLFLAFCLCLVFALWGFGGLWGGRGGGGGSGFGGGGGRSGFGGGSLRGFWGRFWLWRVFDLRKSIQFLALYRAKTIWSTALYRAVFRLTQAQP